MALIDINVYSQVLNEHRPIRVILPTPTSALYTQDIPYYQGKKYQTLFLLHGGSGDHTVWSRYSKIEWYAQQNQLAVVMTSVNNSFYTDMKYYLDYYTFYTEELPKIVYNLLPLSQKKEDTFIAGMSMGGYGTWRIGLGYPERFSAMAILSSSMFLYEDVNNDGSPATSINKTYKTAFGSIEEYKNSENDVAELMIKRLKDKTELPKIYMCCGTEDFLYDSNLKTKEFLEKNNVAFTYSEGPGKHDWTFWDDQIKEIIEWLPLKHTLVD